LRKLIQHIKAIVILGLLQLTSGCDTDSSINSNFEDYFIKYYGLGGNQSGVDIGRLDDGFIVLGNSTNAVGESSILLIRTDELGNELWSKQLGGLNSSASALASDPNGSFIVAGQHQISTNDSDVLIMRVSADGQLQDSLLIGTPGSEELANDVIVTSEGDIVSLGSTTNVLASNPSSIDMRDIYSVRLSSDFVPFTPVNWRRVTGFDSDDSGTSLIQKSDGSFLFLLTTNSEPTDTDGKGGFNMFIYPVGSDGESTNVSARDWFGTLGDETSSQIVETVTGFSMVGSSESNNQSDIYLARIARNNTFLSEGRLNLGLNVSGVSLHESVSGGLLILGTNRDGANGDIYLAKTSTSGSVLWENTFGGLDNDEGKKVIDIEDGSVVLVGTVELESQTKIALIKTNSEGQLNP